MSQHTEGFGDRLRDVRKRRGLTQRELAAAAGVSVSLIKKLEQGEQDTRVETARKLAAALRVETTVLVSRPAAEAGPAPEPWRPLQRAVETPAPPPVADDGPTLDGITAALPALRRAYFANELGAVGDVLPPLLRDAEALGSPARGARARTPDRGQRVDAGAPVRGGGYRAAPRPR